jgi:hypothetical protein
MFYTDVKFTALWITLQFINTSKIPDIFLPSVGLCVVRRNVATTKAQRNFDSQVHMRV